MPYFEPLFTNCTFPAYLDECIFSTQLMVYIMCITTLRFQPRMIFMRNEKYQYFYSHH